MSDQHDMKSHRHAILECLQQHVDDDLRLIPALQLLLEEQGPEACKILIHILTNLDLTTGEAMDSWGRIIDHWEGLCGVLRRQISLRTAICDYFCSIDRRLYNPKLVELKLFEQIDTLSKYDNLTNLFNRHYFDDVLARELARATRHRTPLSLLLIDLDDFKKVNDVHGHLAGDKVLRHIAGIMLEEKRTEDIAVRLGGDELAIILPETEKDSVLVIARRIHQRVETTPLLYNGQVIPLTLSAGVASFPRDGTNVKDLLNKTDRALYQAKAAGKNTISVYSDNRRRYHRIDFNKTLELEVMDTKPLSTMTVLSKNISASGMLLVSKSTLDLGARIQLKLPLKPRQTMQVAGKVVRITAYGPESYDIGIAFIHSQRQAAEGINTFIRQEQTAPNQPGQDIAL